MYFLPVPISLDPYASFEVQLQSVTMADKRKAGAEPAACECKPPVHVLVIPPSVGAATLRVVGAVSWAQCDAGVIYGVVPLSHAASPPR